MRNKFELFCMWLVWDSGINLGKLAPFVFGLGMGKMPKQVGFMQDGIEIRIDKTK